MAYKVLTRSTEKNTLRTYSEYETLEEALAVAKRLENNTELEVVVDVPTWCFNNTTLKLV